MDTENKRRPCLQVEEYVPVLPDSVGERCIAPAQHPSSARAFSFTGSPLLVVLLWSENKGGEMSVYVCFLLEFCR